MSRKFEEDFNDIYGSQRLRLTRFNFDNEEGGDDLILRDLSNGKKARLPTKEMERLLTHMLVTRSSTAGIAGLWAKLNLLEES